jgi:hypothetical protein
MGTKEYRKPEWVTHMEELQEKLRGNNVMTSCMPEHDNSDSDVVSVDSLETGSAHHQHAHVGPTKKITRVPGGSMTSLGDVSIGDDSVFVSNASSSSDDLNSMTTLTAVKSSVHVPATAIPFLLDPPESSPEDCHLSVSLQPSVQITIPKNEGTGNVETSSVATGSDYAHLIITDYLNSHRLSITAAIEALDTDETAEGDSDKDKQASVVKSASQDAKKITEIQNSSSGSPEHVEQCMSVERPILHLHECKEKSEEVLEIIYVPENEDHSKTHPVASSFYLLSPIQENSEASTESSCNGGNNGGGAHKLGGHDDSTMKLLSASCEVISMTDASMTSHTLQTKYQTFPRSKIPVLSPMRTNACYSVPEDPTMYPLEPRELDPASFHQLHTADSQEELQEFLLLESQCMTTDGQGLAAAFVVSDDEHFHSDEDDHCTVSGISVASSYWVLGTAVASYIKINGNNADGFGILKYWLSPIFRKLL